MKYSNLSLTGSWNIGNDKYSFSYDDARSWEAWLNWTCIFLKCANLKVPLRIVWDQKNRGLYKNQWWWKSQLYLDMTAKIQSFSLCFLNHQGHFSTDFSLTLCLSRFFGLFTFFFSLTFIYVYFCDIRLQNTTAVRIVYTGGSLQIMKYTHAR